MPIKTYTMTLKWQKDLAPGVRHFAFTRDDSQPLQFVPGQFVTLHFTANDKPVQRSYSIGTVPDESDDIELIISYVEHGLASELLFNIEPGYKIATSGPYGKLILRDPHPERYILVSTGVGITPFRAMRPALRQAMQEHNVKVVLLFGVRRRVDAFLQDEFLQFAAENPNFDFRIQYSREEATDLKPYEHMGYVQTTLGELNATPGKDVAYLCGNPNMIDQGFETLKEIGFTVADIRREKYISVQTNPKVKTT